MAICDKTTELLIRLNPAFYRPYIWYTKSGVPMLYVQIEKALYGMLRAALILYCKLRADLEDMWFKVNLYNPCVTNEIVNGNQCTMVWHGDNLKVSHKDKAILTYFAQELGRRNRNKLKIKRDKVFDCLEMNIDFESCPGTLIISMIKYLSAMNEEWPEELKGYTPNPHQEHLFEVRPDDDSKKELLNEKMSRSFIAQQRSCCSCA